MKEILLMYARYTQRANASVLGLLDGLSAEARNVDRKSYYKSLSGLAAHAFGGLTYFHGMFRVAAPAAAAALRATEGLSCPEGEKLDAAQWAELNRAVTIADQATIDFIEAASEKDLSALVKVPWLMKERPEGVPICFLLHSIYVHGTHHRGQISQVLDEMGIEHDFSGLDVEFLPK